MTQASEQVLPVGLAPEPQAWFRRLAKSKSLQLAAGFFAILVVMGRIEFAGPAILDNDGYYHIRWSKMVRESLPRLPAFKALPLTTLSESKYVDHHFLFHVLLMPFTFGDLRVGAKVAAALFSSLGIASIFMLLVVYRVRYKFLWLAPLIASSEPFLYRFAMTRAPSLSLALLGAGAYLILKRKLVWLAVLSFAFVWFYSLFPLIIAFAAIHTLTVYLAERRIVVGAPVAAFCGALTGMIVNPYFPKNFSLFLEHIVMKANTSADYTVKVGVEWYPYESWTLVASSAAAFVIFIVALLAFDYRARLRDPKPLFFLMISVMMLLMTFKSRRFIEYWPPFAIAFAAFTISPKLKGFDRQWFGRSRDRAIAAMAASAATVLLASSMIWTVREACQDIKDETDPYAYKGASEWIAAHTEPGSMIFNTDWDDFPMLFYYNPANTYIVGLDPTYLYDADHDLWKLYARITLGKENDPAPLIRDRFGARYVYTDNEHTDFLGIARDSGDFEEVYKDDFSTVLRVRGPDEPRLKKETAEPQDEDSGDDDEER